jgi:hypothetical protein
MQKKNKTPLELSISLYGFNTSPSSVVIKNLHRYQAFLNDMLLTIDQFLFTRNQFVLFTGVGTFRPE